MTPEEASRAEVEPEPFEEFYRREYRPVVAVLVSLIGDMTRAEDFAQDAFVAAHRRWSRIVRYDKPAAWVRRVALNRWRSAWRRARREVRLGAFLVDSEDPDREVLSEESERVWSEVRSLPRRQAQCVALRYLDELTTGEIAEVLGCAEATVRVHLHRAHDALATRLGSERQSPA
jgi:RNA polymerase sigma-70 factor (ECF subfamily)